jgi:hypothetical protein
MSEHINITPYTTEFLLAWNSRKNTNSPTYVFGNEEKISHIKSILNQNNRKYFKSLKIR